MDWDDDFDWSCIADSFQTFDPHSAYFPHSAYLHDGMQFAEQKIAEGAGCLGNLTNPDRIPWVVPVIVQPVFVEDHQISEEKENSPVDYKFSKPVPELKGTPNHSLTEVEFQSVQYSSSILEVCAGRRAFPEIHSPSSSSESESQICDREGSTRHYRQQSIKKWRAKKKRSNLKKACYFWKSVHAISRPREGGRFKKQIDNFRPIA